MNSENELGNIGYYSRSGEEESTVASAAPTNNTRQRIHENVMRRLRSAQASGVPESKEDDEDEDRIIPPVAVPAPITRESTFSTLNGIPVNYEPNRRNSVVNGNGFLRLSAPGATGNLLMGGPLRTEVRILFVRHSESCANMLKKFQKGVYPAHTLYVDPELTRRGQQMAQERGRQLTELVEQKLGTAGPLYFGASGLRRTQQTAITLLQNSQLEATNGVIYALPYVSEVGQTADNRVPGPGERAGLSMVDYSLLDGAARGYFPDVNQFFKWLGSSSGLLGTATTVRMVIATHAGWMKSLAKQLGVRDARYENLDAAAVTITYGSDRAILAEKSWIEGGQRLVFVPAGGWDALAAAACPDECVGRGAPICSGAPGTICDRLADVYRSYKQVSLPTIQALEKDLRIMESYRQDGGRPQVLAALENLRKYAGGGFFRAARSRNQLPGDLLPLIAAYGCQAAGSAEESVEACQLVRAALAGRVSDANIERIANLGRAPSLRNYTRKSSGWFGLRWGTRYTKSRNGLRRNLERVRDSVCPAPPVGGVNNLSSVAGAVSNANMSVQAVEPTPSRQRKPLLFPPRYYTRRGGGHKKRATRRGRRRA